VTLVTDFDPHPAWVHADLDANLVVGAPGQAGWPISPPIAALTRDGHVVRDGSFRSVLALLASDAIDLADSPDLALVRWCADPFCTRPFVDRSRGHRRRWCGMRGCGDRAKAAAYRRRQRERTP